MFAPLTIVDLGTWMISAIDDNDIDALSISASVSPAAAEGGLTPFATVTVGGGATLAMGASSDMYGVGEGSRWLWACVATSTFLSR